MHQARKSKEARVLFDQGDLDALCWCGAHVCGISESADELRIHRGGKAASEVIADGVGKTTYLTCDSEQVGWKKAGAGESSEVHLVPLQDPGGKARSVGEP